MLVCGLPTGLTVLATGLFARRSPEERVVLALGGTGFRLISVLAAAVVLRLLAGTDRVASSETASGKAVAALADPDRRAFWVWLIGFYLFTLAWEMVVLTARPADDR